MTKNKVDNFFFIIIIHPASYLCIDSMLTSTVFIFPQSVKFKNILQRYTNIDKNETFLFFIRETGKLNKKRLRSNQIGMIIAVCSSIFFN